MICSVFVSFDDMMKQYLKTKDVVVAIRMLFVNDDEEDVNGWCL